METIKLNPSGLSFLRDVDSPPKASAACLPGISGTAFWTL